MNVHSALASPSGGSPNKNRQNKVQRLVRYTFKSKCSKSNTTSFISPAASTAWSMSYMINDYQYPLIWNYCDGVFSHIPRPTLHHRRELCRNSWSVICVKPFTSGSTYSLGLGQWCLYNCNTVIWKPCVFEVVCPLRVAIELLPKLCFWPVGEWESRCCCSFRHISVSCAILLF